MSATRTRALALAFAPQRAHKRLLLFYAHGAPRLRAHLREAATRVRFKCSDGFPSAKIVINSIGTRDLVRILDQGLQLLR